MKISIDEEMIIELEILRQEMKEANLQFGIGADKERRWKNKLNKIIRFAKK